MFDLLTAAALQIWDRRKAAMIIVALPLVLNGLAEILFLFFTGDDVLWPDLILFVTSMGTVPLIAVAWHRLVLQSAPVRAVPAGPFAVHLRFLWEWFWLGFGLGVVLALGLVAKGQAILWAAFWASLVQAAVFWLPSYVFLPREGADPVDLGHVFRALAVSLSYTAGILIGAAVLNVIYQRARLPS